MVSVSSSVLPSASRTSRVNLTISSYIPVDSVVVAWGSHTGAPATYSDLSSGTYIQAIFADEITINKQPGLSNMTLQFTLGASWSKGDQLWFCVFAGAPAGTDVPLATAGPFVVGD